MKEKKEALVEQPVLSEEEQMKLKEKKALNSFILAMIANFGIGILISFLSVVGSFLTIALLLVPVCYIVGIVLSGISLGNVKKSKGVEKQPYKVFRILGLVFGIIGLVINILSLIFMVILLILVILAIIVGIVFLIGYVIMMVIGVLGAGASFSSIIAEILAAIGAGEEALVLLLALL